MKKNVWLKRFSAKALKEQFNEIIDLLNEKHVPYYVDCGALLGIVRDGDLLPWDNDTDLAINAEDTEKLTSVIKDIQKLGWSCEFKTFSENNAFATQQDYRVLKVYDTWLWVFQRPHADGYFFVIPNG
jgi:phosphorylcholine metabolism protein LicD